MNFFIWSFYIYLLPVFLCTFTVMTGGPANLNRVSSGHNASYLG